MQNRKPTGTITIGNLAKRSGVSVRSIRHYEEEGVLTCYRGDNGYRFFSIEAITQVRQIQRLISFGFNLKDIRTFPECMRLVEGAEFCEETLSAQQSLLQSIDHQIETLEERKYQLLKTMSENISQASVIDER